MIIGTKYWAEGASAPASFTDTDVLTCHPREVIREYDSKTALDGTQLSWSRTYLAVDITFGPLTMLDATKRAAALAFAKARRMAVRDARHASLGASNTIVFVRQGDVQIQRDSATMLEESMSITLISESPV